MKRYARLTQKFGEGRSFSFFMQELPRGKLTGALPPAIVMTVTIASTTTKGTPLPDAGWQAVLRACDLADRLEEARKKVRDQSSPITCVRQSS